MPILIKAMTGLGVFGKIKMDHLNPLFVKNGPV
jgi:hypothetical protein